MTKKMPRVWKKLSLERSEAPEISISDRADVQEILEWSAVQLKAEKFDDIDFDHIVTDNAMRQFLGYTIPANKKLLTRRGKGKKKGDASHQNPKSPRPPIQKKTAETETTATKRRRSELPLWLPVFLERGLQEEQRNVLLKRSLEAQSPRLKPQPKKVR